MTFPKTQRDVITVTIDEDGDLIFLQTDSADIFMELGKTITKRASHVEPATFWARVAFHILRALVTDDSDVAAWTREWKCAWRINTKPVGGPILTVDDVGMGYLRGDEIAEFSNRSEAITAEIEFLNTFFLERGI